ncbi:acyl-CoA dehydrogenase family protein [Roseovarius sp.]|uniref:acyl-CoA dehydrogenase family protein n=1 Tax=Roseovarius sp. TaxID=1486281 RepID=UPI003A974A26
MHESPAEDMFDSHQVVNQPAARGDLDLWAGDPALRTHVQAAGADPESLAVYGARLGSEALRAAGRAANRHPPELLLFDAGGRRRDEVMFHPAYHELMRVGIGAGYAALPWEGAPGGHATHAAMVYLTSQVEPGVCCPMTMTYAAVPALKADKALFSEWVPKLTARTYDPSTKPLARKPAATLGMAMTEKQGGSDIRANATTATPEGDHYRLLGHKWFCSAPMSDGFLTLAQAHGGLTCFLVPRWLEGARNPIRIQRLKDKLGNRANASAEIEYHGALAYRLGEEGAGLRTILEMVHHTRLDTAMAPAGLMRAALDSAHHWACHRSAFQKQLIDQPLMRAVLADLALDWEGTLALGLCVARAFDGRTAQDRAFARLGVALAKFLGNKLCPGVVYEAMEAMGGMGYVEDTPLPLLYREAPLNSIWEGSGNVICLDILRTLRKEPLAGEALSAELAQVAGQDRRFDAAMTAHMQTFPKLPDEAQARWYAESLATLLTASVLMRHAPDAVAGAYIATRLSDPRGRVAGAVGTLDTAPILARLGDGVR